ncbi:Cytochrome P450 4g15 [Ooceraea biroi]|uniref:Cytochrome P450 4g15 n=1 Tax=Ooceraea biroi TaxID=2015173 RepID=A0A026W3Z9_OOCBI|nr:Cytochrome P450 4g15 [Ooceraea biroi]
MIVGVLLSCAVTAFLYYYVIHLARFRYLLNRIPGPRMLPIFGDIFEVLLNPSQGWYFIIGWVVILNPHDIQTILSSTKYNTKGYVYKFLRPWLKDGLLISKGIAIDLKLFFGCTINICINNTGCLAQGEKSFVHR